MNKIIIISLILLSTNSFANDVLTICPNNGGENRVIFNDATVPSGQPVHLTATNKVRLRDLGYPLIGLASQLSTQCIDGSCRTQTYAQSLVVPMQGLVGTFPFDVVFPALTQGAHSMIFEVYLPEYACRTRATATITAV